MSTKILCPLLDCDWSFDATMPAVSDGDLAQVFGIGVFAATAASQHAEYVEAELRAHFRLHGAAEFLATISSLRKERDDLAEQVARVRALHSERGRKDMCDGCEVPGVLVPLVWCKTLAALAPPVDRAVEHLHVCHGCGEEIAVADQRVVRMPDVTEYWHDKCVNGEGA